MSLALNERAKENIGSYFAKKKTQTTSPPPSPPNPKKPKSMSVREFRDLCPASFSPGLN